MTVHPGRWTVAAMCGVLSTVIAANPAPADSFRDRQWHLKTLDVAAAHKVSQGDGVTVAVLDTGVQADHPDITGNVLPGIDLTGADTQGRKDTDGHGTGMAGVIVGHGHGSSAGALGIAPAAKILPIRIMIGDSDGAAGGTNMPEAIDQAVKRGANIISISQMTSPSPRLKRALDGALSSNVIVVAAAGNRPDDFYVQYPARYPGVVAVGATGRNGSLSSVSVTGEELLLAAPGVDILSTDNGGGYHLGTGTSDATAIVAGAAALVRSKFPKLSATEVVHRLTATADDKGAPGRDNEYGFGTLNLVAALTAQVPPAGEPQPSTGPTTPAAGSDATETPTEGQESVALKPNAAFFVVLGVLALLLIGGGGLVVWLVIRGRRRRHPPSGPHSYPPHAEAPAQTSPTYSPIDQNPRS
jgi:type VII secretion-associated serine protease mycosin